MYQKYFFDLILFVRHWLFYYCIRSFFIFKIFRYAELQMQKVYHQTYLLKKSYIILNFVYTLMYIKSYLNAEGIFSLQNVQIFSNNTFKNLFFI